jgi:outer membrane autotransporter protein
VVNDAFTGYDHVEVNITGNYSLSGPKGWGYYSNNNTATSIDAQTILITTNGMSADAIRTNSTPTLIINGQLTVKAQGSSGDGINAANSNNSGALIQINGDNAHIESRGGIGVRANLTANARGNEISIAKNATIITNGSGSNTGSGSGYAVYAGDRDHDPVNLPQVGTARISISDGSTIRTAGSNAYAVYANKTGVIQLGDTNVTTTGSRAHGIVAQDGEVDYGYYTIPSLSLGWNSYGTVRKYTGGQVYLAGNTAITVDTTKNSDAMYSSGENSLIISGTAGGLTASGVYTVTGDLVADREGGIRLNATAGSVFNSNVNVVGTTTPTGLDNSFIDLVMSGTQLTGNIDASVSGVATLDVIENSVVAGNITANSAGGVNFGADNSTYTGDVTALDGGRVQMMLTSGTVFTGATDKTNAATAASVADGTINITMDGSTTHWQMTEDSNVNNLIMTNGAQVSIGDQSVLPVTSSNRAVLTVDNLSGNGGIFNARTEMCDNEADRLVITNSSSGSHYLHFNDAKAGSYFGTEEALVVEFTGSDATQNQATFSSAGVDVGPYVYSLEFKADSNWYLNTSTVTPSTPYAPEHQIVLPAPPTLNNAADRSANILNINYLLNYAEIQTLLQRMGELRQAPGAQGDVWVRVMTGEMDKFDGVRLSSFDMKYSGVQIGVDRQLDIEGAGQAYVGVMAGTSKANADYAVGSGDTKSYHVGVYGTYKADDGFYVDGIAKYVYMDNSFNTLTSNGYYVDGDGSTKGFTIGVEAGKRFYITQPQQGWYLEPQAQLTFSHQNGATINSSTGLRTDLDSYDSTLGRLSVIAGYSITEGKNPIDVYIKTGYVREFSGDTGYTFNHYNHESYDFGGGWWDNGIGVNMQINGRHNIYMDATYAKGGSFDHKQLNIGYRFSF